MEENTDPHHPESSEESGVEDRTPGVQLTFEESRVLGCLIEKEKTTPEYYPMTLNALNAACNQKNNRNPVTAFDESTVLKAMEGLRVKKLAMQVSLAGSRVPKFKHTIARAFDDLDDAGIALLCVLMLRGPQTVGELRGRTERMHPFADLVTTEDAVVALANRSAQSLATCLPPGGGRKAKTYAHLLCGDVEQWSASPAPKSTSPVAPAAARSTGDDSWRADMEADIEDLKKQVEDLRDAVEQLRDQAG